jgi:hypothetical protein
VFSSFDCDINKAYLLLLIALACLRIWTTRRKDCSLEKVNRNFLLLLCSLTL